MGYSSLDTKDLQKRGRGDSYAGQCKDLADNVMYNLMDVRDALKRGDAKRAMSLIQKEIKALDRY